MGKKYFWKKGLFNGNGQELTNIANELSRIADALEKKNDDKNDKI